MRTHLTSIACAIAILAGCGVEYTAGRRAVRSTPQAEYRETPPPTGRGAGYDASLGTQTVSVIDRTGILRAIFGTMANAHIAREEAIKDAIKTGKTGEIGYSYETTPVVPGFELRLYYSWGSTTGFTMDRLTMQTEFNDNALTFSEMGMRLNFLSRRLGKGKRLYWGIAWDTRIVKYDFESTPRAMLNPANSDIDYSVVYLPVEANVSYLFTPRIRTTLSAEYDPFLGIIALAGLELHQQYGAGVRTEFMITPWLIAHGGVELQRGNEGSSEFTRRVDSWIVGFGLSLQTPPRFRK